MNLWKTKKFNSVDSEDSTSDVECDSKQNAKQANTYVCERGGAYFNNSSKTRFTESLSDGSKVLMPSLLKTSTILSFSKP